MRKKKGKGARPNACMANVWCGSDMVAGYVEVRVAPRCSEVQHDDGIIMLLSSSALGAGSVMAASKIRKI